MTLDYATIQTGWAKVDGHTSRQHFGIYANHTLTIHMIGDNTIEPEDPTSTTGITNGIWVEGNLCINGEGSLKVRASDAGTMNSHGIKATKITLKNGTLIAEAGKAEQHSLGLVGEFLVQGGEATCIGGQAKKHSTGIQGKLIIEDGVVTTRADFAGDHYLSRGLDGILSMRGGKLIASGKTKALDSYHKESKIDFQHQILIGTQEDGSDAKVRETEKLGEYQYVSIGPVSYLLTVAGDQEEVSPTRTWVEPGATVSLKATPKEGYVFHYWDVEGELSIADSKQAETTFIMPERALFIKAMFKEESAVPDPSTPPEPAIPSESVTPASPEQKESSAEIETISVKTAPLWSWWTTIGGTSAGKVSEQASIDKVQFQLGATDLIYMRGQSAEVQVMDVAPFIHRDRLMVPIRFVAQALGFTVDWDQASRTAILRNGQHTVEIPVDTKEIYVDGKCYESDVPSMIHQDRTMLPLGNVARALGLQDGKDLFWDQETKTVTIRRKSSR